MVQDILNQRLRRIIIYKSLHSRYCFTDCCNSAVPDCGLFLQVVSAKIVTSAKSPGSKRFGFVTMNTSEEAQQCIDLLNKTELNGRIIQVERVSFRLPAVSGYFIPGLPVTGKNWNSIGD